MKYLNWKLPAPLPPAPPALLNAGLTELLASILALRGWGDLDTAEEFLLADERTLHAPEELLDMTRAVERIRTAIDRGEHVAVYGDYDVDGITAASLLSDYLRSRRSLTCETYIPDRLDEGYGLNTAAIDFLHKQGVTLIITVDCGVTSVEEAAYAKSLGIDMVITDHHECREQLPDAVAVVDPKRPGSSYRGEGLAGVGVAFKLVCALMGDAEEALRQYGDLLAVGTVADVMPVVGENRYLILQGLEKLNSDRCRLGLSALLKSAGAAEKKITATSIGYSIAPRINAAGRLGDTRPALELLSTSSPAEAEKLANELYNKNTERQKLEQEIWRQAVRLIGEDKPTAPLVLDSGDWHPGVIGIVASRLAEAYSVPAIMICLKGDKGKGSCRSVNGFNLHEALVQCEDCLESFGGHAMAAGLTIRKDRIGELRSRLAELYKGCTPGEASLVEAEISVGRPSLLSEANVQSLDFLEPCGNGNARPLFYMEDCVLSDLASIGGGKHMKLRLNKFNETYNCVFFSQTPEKLGAGRGDRVDVIFAPQINEYRGTRSVQLVITDLRLHGRA